MDSFIAENHVTAARLLQDFGTRPLFRPISVDEYHQMISAHILIEGEPYELLNGFIVRKDRGGSADAPTKYTPQQSYVIGTLATLGPRFNKLGSSIQTQQPITLPPLSEPEPDAAVILGRRIDRYTTRHPGPRDVTCVIEVADGSLRLDRSLKHAIYAGAGIEQYVVINLPERAIEVYTEPEAGRDGAEARYGRATTLSDKQTVELAAAGGKALKVPVRKLLPPVTAPRS